MTNVVRIEELRAARRPQESLQAEERSTFESTFPPLPLLDPTPTVTWAEMERQLLALAGSPAHRRTAQLLIRELRMDATWRSPEMFFRKLAIVCAVVLEEPSPPFGEAPMS